MILQSLIHDHLSNEAVSSWWIQINIDQKFEFASYLHEQLYEASKKYCEKADIWDLYYNLTHKYEKSLRELCYPIDWNLDLHQSSDNYENFQDCKDEIIRDLAKISVDWFYELIHYLPELTANELKIMLISYLEELPIW